MNRQLTAIIEREGDGYDALCPEVDVASQGDSVAEARDNLKEALTLFFKTASSEETDRRLQNEVYVTRIEVTVGPDACFFWSRGLSETYRSRFRRGEKTWPGGQ